MRPKPCGRGDGGGHSENDEDRHGSAYAVLRWGFAFMLAALRITPPRRTCDQAKLEEDRCGYDEGLEICGVLDHGNLASKLFVRHRVHCIFEFPFLNDTTISNQPIMGGYYQGLYRFFVLLVFFFRAKGFEK